jgi:rhodanese-related sulfurtransferase
MHQAIATRLPHADWLAQLLQTDLQTRAQGHCVSTNPRTNDMKFLQPTLLALALTLSASFACAQSDAQATPKATAASAGVAAAAAPVYKGRAPKLSREALDKYLASPDKVVLIDLRRPDELIAIGGFPVYLSIQSKDLQKSLAFIPRDRDIITISNHAGRAGAGANLLLDNGFKVVGAVGAQDYEAEGGKLIKITAPAPRQAAAEAVKTL